MRVSPGSLHGIGVSRTCPVLPVGPCLWVPTCVPASLPRSLPSWPKLCVCARVVRARATLSPHPALPSQPVCAHHDTCGSCVWRARVLSWGLRLQGSPGSVGGGAGGAGGGGSAAAAAPVPATPAKETHDDLPHSACLCVALLLSSCFCARIPLAMMSLCTLCRCALPRPAPMLVLLLQLLLRVVAYMVG